MQDRKVYIILVNYNGFEDTAECIESLEKITYPNYKTIVVDNASTIPLTAEQQNYLRDRSIFLQSSENLGFSGGNNLGIRYALEHNADYVLLLNNDTIVTPDFLTYMVSAYEKYSDIGCVIGRIHFYYEPDIVWYAGGKADFQTMSVCHENWGKNYQQIKEVDQSRKVTFATGCLMLISADALKKTGLLREQYFLYDEDTDYCFRLMRDGYSLYYEKDALIYHKVSRATGAFSLSTQYYMMRNQLMIIREFGNAKNHAYRSIMIQAVKDVVRKRKSLKPLLYAIKDFSRNVYGKNTHEF